jgi:hypothetical protein
VIRAGVCFLLAAAVGGFTGARSFTAAARADAGLRAKEPGRMQTQTSQPGPWRSLFDGKTTGGWRGFRQKVMPAGWKAIDGTLTRDGSAGDIVSLDEFSNFELAVDWKIAAGANSGIFYRVVEDDRDQEMWMAAPEYQVIDDLGYKGPLKPTQKTGANYDLHPPSLNAVRPAGEWNTTRIVVNGAHVEHWLNGKKVVEYELWSGDWEKLVAASKFKDHPRYARARTGRIGLQDHGDWVAYRNIRIRELR